MIQKIAVLLTCFNRKDKTLNCLTTLYAAIVPEGYCFDVFLVDDGSKDGTAEAVKIKFPDVNIINGTGDLYWNRGMHLAWKTAVDTKVYDFYLWLNDDVKVNTDGLKVLLDDFNKAKNALICGIMASELNGEITYGGRDKSGVILRPKNESSQLCHYINGNFVLVSKQIYDQVGMLDPLFPHAIGDFDYGLRAMKLGFECRVSSQVVGYCEANPQLPVWCRPEVNFKKRLQSLYSPLGNSHPYYYFKYELRHFGPFVAIKHYLTIHLRLIAPQLWK